MLGHVYRVASGIIRVGSHGLVVKAEGFCLLRLENPHPEECLRIRLVSAFPTAALS